MLQRPTRGRATAIGLITTVSATLFTQHLQGKSVVNWEDLPPITYKNLTQRPIEVSFLKKIRVLTSGELSKETNSLTIEPQQEIVFKDQTNWLNENSASAYSKPSGSSKWPKLHKFNFSGSCRTLDGSLSEGGQDRDFFVSLKNGEEILDSYRPKPALVILNDLKTPVRLLFSKKVQPLKDNRPISGEFVGEVFKIDHVAPGTSVELNLGYNTTPVLDGLQVIIDEEDKGTNHRTPVAIISQRGPNETSSRYRENIPLSTLIGNKNRQVPCGTIICTNKTNLTLELYFQKPVFTQGQPHLNVYLEPGESITIEDCWNETQKPNTMYAHAQQKRGHLWWRHENTVASSDVFDLTGISHIDFQLVLDHKGKPHKVIPVSNYSSAT